MSLTVLKSRAERRKERTDFLPLAQRNTRFMFAEERRAEIAKLVASARRVNGADLARRYDVTMETVRRDLAALEEAGKLRRVHGGAVTIE